MSLALVVLPTLLLAVSVGSTAQAEPPRITGMAGAPMVLSPRCLELLEERHELKAELLNAKQKLHMIHVMIRALIRKGEEPPPALLQMAHELEAEIVFVKGELDLNHAAIVDLKCY